jgi:hypothetical protein
MRHRAESLRPVDSSDFAAIAFFNSRGPTRFFAGRCYRVTDNASWLPLVVTRFLEISFVAGLRWAARTERILNETDKQFVLKSIEEEGLLSFVTGSKRPFRMIQFFNRIGQKLPVGSLNVNQASQPHRPLAVVLRAQASCTALSLFQTYCDG